MTTIQTDASILNQVGQNTAVLVSPNGAEYVVMPKKEWDSWQETLYLMSNPINAARVLEGIRQIEQGQVVSKKLEDL
jgi:antitoxin YefM